MKKAFLFLLISIMSWAQTYKIAYKTSFEGKINENQDPIVVFANKTENYILSEAILNKKKSFPYEVVKNNIVDFKTTHYGLLSNDKIAASDTDKLQKSHTYVS